MFRRKNARQRIDQEDEPKPILDINVQSEVSLWKRIAMMSMTVGILGMVSTIICVLLFAQILPLKQVVPFILTLDQRENAVYTLEPLNRDGTAWDYVIENLVCQYVIARNEVRPNDGFMVSRWGAQGVVQILSRRDVFEKFQSASFERLSYYEDNQYTREITLLSPPTLIERFPDERRYYRIDFREEVKDPNKLKTIYSAAWTATLGVVPGEKRVLEGNRRFVNPIGLAVFQYTEAQLLNPGLLSAKGDAGDIVKCGGRTG